MMYQVTMTVRNGTTELCSLHGKKLELNLGEVLPEVIRMEQLLEKMTGFRFHLFLEPVEPGLNLLDKLLQEERESR